MIPFFTLLSKRTLNVSLLLFLLVANGFLPQTLTAQCLTYQTTGLYSFTVPAGGPFQITISARGGDGGSGQGGSGATAKATFSVQAGDVLTSMVGDNGIDYIGYSGGGGGSAVILNRNGTLSLLVAAGGGGGNGRIRGDGTAGGGGQGGGPATGGAGGGLIDDRADESAGGGGGGGLNGPGGDGATQDARFPRNGAGGGQASLTALSAGGSANFINIRNSSGGAGFGGGGGSGSLPYSTGGGGGGYGGGNGGTGSSASQGGYSFVSSTAGNFSITPGVSGGSQRQDGSVIITFPASPVSAAITGGNTTVCAGQSATITGTVNAVGTWTIVLNDGTTKSGTGTTFSIPVTPPSSTTYSIQCLFDSRGVAQTGNVSGSQVVVVNPPVTITQQPASSSSVCIGTNVSTFVRASGTVSSYQWYRNGGVVSGQTSATLTLPNTTTTNSGSYVVVVTGCNSVTSTAFNLMVNPLPTPSIVGLASAYCQDAGSQSLSGSPAGGVFTVDSSPATSFNPASLSVGQHTVVYSYTNSSGCAATTSANVTVNAPPSAPTLVTQSGYAYPAGVSSLTIAQNTGPVSLTVSGCSGGMLLANGNAASSFTVSTAMTGTQTYTATCTQGGCTSPAGSFQLMVVPTTLSVLHKDVDYGQTQDQIIKPFLKLANTGGQPVPYGELTVRYWFTAEGNSPPTDFQLYYAQLGAVILKYVPLAQPRQGAFGYVEYSFPGGGSLPANGNSGPIENGILKTDRSNFNETDDYSYQPNRDYLPNARITAYRNGVIVWGQEPTPVASQTAVQVYSAAKDGGITSQIQTRLELRNTGNVALAVAALKLRYYFTSDNGQTANVYVDYADLGASNVQARVVRLASPVNGADSYVELSFPGTPRQLGPLSSLGVIDFRLVRSDFGLLNQGNDYSYAPIYGPVGLNNRVTVLLNNTLLFGTPPSGAPARVGASEPVLALQVTVLGNPVVGSQAQIEIRGAEGQVVNVRLVDLQGRTIHEQRIEQAGETEPVSLPLGQSRGLLLLKVSTASQQQRLKLVRP